MTDAARPTLRALLARRDLALVAVVDGDVDVEIRWVHSSDLADPTPFLSEGLALLTTGTQFDPDDGVDVYDAYVARLAARGVVALGFGTEVVREGVPPLLMEAALAHRMPLVEVPYRTPFIAVARANAEAVAAQAYARRSWSLAAQRTIAHAALRPEGLSATVTELARQLEAWVGLYGAGGALAHEAGADLSPDHRATVDAEAAALLHRRQSAATTAGLGDDRLVVQTLGRGGHLRGALAVVGPRLDTEARAVVAAVAAMAALALEQSGAVRRAHDALGDAALQALADGDPDLAARLAEVVGGLPATASVAVVDASARDRLAGWLSEQRERVLAGVVGGDLALLLEDAADADAIARECGLAVGVSAPTGLDGFATALDQARHARRRAGSGVGRFTASGVLSASSTDDARAHAAALLAPLLAHDAAHGTALAPTLGAWLDEDGGNDAAARVLGVHRHTVRARIALVERVLGRSLSTFPARAEVWLALRLNA